MSYKNNCGICRCNGFQIKCPEYKTCIPGPMRSVKLSKFQIDIRYHIKCHDCGQFLKKGKWVRKDHSWKVHALCSECYSSYDDPRYL